MSGLFTHSHSMGQLNSECQPPHSLGRGTSEHRGVSSPERKLEWPASPRVSSCTGILALSLTFVIVSGCNCFSSSPFHPGSQGLALCKFVLVKVMVLLTASYFCLQIRQRAQSSGEGCPTAPLPASPSALLLQVMTFSSSSSLTSLTSKLHPRSFWTPPALGEHNYLQGCLEMNKAWVMAGTHLCQDHHSTPRLAQSCLWGCWLPKSVCNQSVTTLR